MNTVKINTMAQSLVIVYSELSEKLTQRKQKFRKQNKTTTLYRCEISVEVIYLQTF